MKKRVVFFLLFVLVLTSGFGCQLQKTEQTKEQNNESAPTAVNVIAVKDLPSGSYQIDSAQSKLGWFAEKIASNRHPGDVQIKDGALIIENGVLTSGEFVMDMTTIRDVDQTEGLIKHLKSDDFFAVATYPESKFKITKAVLLADNPDGSAKYKLTGDLTIKDKTNQIDFEAELSATDQGLRGVAEFTIDRTLWDLKFGSGKFFQDLGDKAIKDEIKYNIDILTVLGQ